MQDNKLDQADLEFVLRLIRDAQTAGIAELTYRGIHVRFHRASGDEPQRAAISAVRAQQRAANNGFLPVSK